MNNEYTFCHNKNPSIDYAKGCDELQNHCSLHTSTWFSNMLIKFEKDPGYYPPLFFHLQRKSE